MAKSIFIVGTDTDVGKTFVASGISYMLNQMGYKACCFKPVQSGGVMVDGKFVSADIDYSINVSGVSGDHSDYNSYCFKEEVSPHLAAELENVTIDMKNIVHVYKQLTISHDYVIVEGAGGVIVPLVRNNLYVHDLIKALDIPVAIVCKTGVGTINHTALTVDFLKNKGIDIKGLIFNGYTDSFYENDNLSILKDLTELPVLSVLNKLDKANSDNFINLAQCQYKKDFNMGSIMDMF